MYLYQLINLLHVIPIEFLLVQKLPCDNIPVHVHTLNWSMQAPPPVSAVTTMTTPTKTAIVDDLVSYIDRQVEEWCCHADIIGMCQTRQKQLLEMKVNQFCINEYNSACSRNLLVHCKYEFIILVCCSAIWSCVVTQC